MRCKSLQDTVSTQQEEVINDYHVYILDDLGSGLGKVAVPEASSSEKVMTGTNTNRHETDQLHHAGLPSYQKIVVHHPTSEQQDRDVLDHGAENPPLRRRLLHVLGGTMILSLLLAISSYESPNAVSMSGAKEDFVVPISSASKSWASKEMDLEMGKSKDKSKKDKSKKAGKESKKEEKKESKKEAKEEKEESKKEAKEEKEEAKKEAKKEKEEAKKEEKEKKEKEKEEEKAEKEKEKEEEKAKKEKEKEKEEEKAEKDKEKKEKKAEKESNPDEVAKKEYWKEYGKEWKEKGKEWKTKWVKHTPTPTPVSSSTPAPSFTNGPTFSEEPTAV